MKRGLAAVLAGVALAATGVGPCGAQMPIPKDALRDPSLKAPEVIAFMEQYRPAN